MLQAGQEALADHGLTIGVESVSFDDAITAADVPRASAYRAWSDDTSDIGPQLRFHDRLAAELLRSQPGFSSSTKGGALQHTLEAVSPILRELPDDLDERSAEERGVWLRRIHLAGSNANQLSMDDSRLWHCYIAIAAGLMSQKHRSPELFEAWKAGEADLVERYKELYQSMAAMFGFQLRYCYTWEQFDTAAGALAEGLTLRTLVNDHVRGIIRNTGPEGEEEEWTLFAVCFEGLIRQFFEPIKNAPPTVIDHESGHSG